MYEQIEVMEALADHCSRGDYFCILIYSHCLGANSKFRFRFYITYLFTQFVFFVHFVVCMYLTWDSKLTAVRTEQAMYWPRTAVKGGGGGALRP
jgi:hypothetical protein